MILNRVSSADDVPLEFQRAAKVAFAADAINVSLDEARSQLFIKLKLTDQLWRFDPEYMTTHMLEVIGHVNMNGFGSGIRRDLKIEFNDCGVNVEIKGYSRHMASGTNTGLAFRRALVDAFCEYYDRMP